MIAMGQAATGHAGHEQPGMDVMEFRVYSSQDTIGKPAGTAL